jgi:3-oxoacyl-[acyl-carrier protein] reductase
MTLQGKVALVTGSTKGLGKAIVVCFASLGADVVVNYSKDKVAADYVVEAATTSGVKAISVQPDVSKVAEIDKLFKATLDTFGKIDIVVANAGIEKVNIAVVDVTEEDFDLLFRINTKGFAPRFAATMLWLMSTMSFVLE